jgi:hypothetical protein
MPLVGVGAAPPPVVAHPGYGFPRRRDSPQRRLDARRVAGGAQAESGRAFICGGIFISRRHIQPGRVTRDRPAGQRPAPQSWEAIDANLQVMGVRA